MTSPARTPLHVVSRGSNEPVVLLHSGGMSSRQFKRLIDALAPTHHVLAPDFLGSGDNPPWPDDEPFHFTMDVDAVARLTAPLGPVHLVGHSYGGLVALSLARQHPERVRSIALYDPVAFGVLRASADAEGLADLNRVGSDPLFTDPALGGRAAWFEAFVDYWNGPGTFRALPEATRAAFLRVGRKVFYEVRSLMDDATGAQAYRDITAPALLLTGSLSPVAARRVQALLSSALPQATAVIIEGAGHMGPITHAEEVNRVIIGAITRATSKTRRA